MNSTSLELQSDFLVAWLLRWSGWWTDASTSYQPTDAGVENRKLEGLKYRSTVRAPGAVAWHVQILLYTRVAASSAIVLTGTLIRGQLFPSCLLSRGAQTAALVAHQTPGGWQICRHARQISPAGKASGSELVHFFFFFFFLHLLLHQGNRQDRVLRVMSALECPCQSKGGGVLHDSSCWLHGFIGRRGGEVPLLREKKKNQE